MLVAKCMAWMNNVYVAAANAAGNDGVYTYFGRSAIVGNDGRTLGECGEECDGMVRAALDPGIRDARATDQAQNHLFKLLHRGYTGVYVRATATRASPRPVLLLQDVVENPAQAQAQVETITRAHTGVACCPVAGVPNPDDLVTQTQELNLT